MHPIPTPQVLDPDRLLANNRGDFRSDHQDRSDKLDDGLKETCEYGQQLWNTLDRVRSYLLDSLAPDPRSPEASSRPGTAPTGPDDEPGWQSWIETYSAVTSVLCGPHGDSGFGLREAQHAAEIRRSAPTLQLHARHEQLPTGSAHPNPPATTAPAPPETAGESTSRPSTGAKARVVLTAALVVLAARGLLPRRLRG